MVSHCFISKKGSDSLDHVFVSCPYARALSNFISSLLGFLLILLLLVDF